MKIDVILKLCVISCCFFLLHGCKKRNNISLITYEDVVMFHCNNREKEIGIYLNDCLYLDTMYYNRICTLEPEFSKKKINLKNYIDGDAYYVNLSRKYTSIEEMIFSNDKNLNEAFKQRFGKSFSTMNKYVLYGNGKLLIKFIDSNQVLCLKLFLFLPDNLKIERAYQMID